MLIRKMFRLKSLVLAFGVFLITGCSQQPSAGDAGKALNSLVHNACSIASVSNVEKINGFDRTIDGNKYYSIDLTFVGGMKYDKEWSEKYKKYKNRQNDKKAKYEVSMEKFNEVFNAESPKYIELGKSLEKKLSEVNDKIYSASTPEEKQESQAEKSEVEAAIKEGNKNWSEVSERLNKIVEEYSNNLGEKGVSKQETIDFPYINLQYEMPRDMNYEKIDPIVPEGCDHLYEEGAAIILGPIIHAASKNKSFTPDKLYDGISVDLEMTVLMQKSEKGWILAK